ncbi:MAG: TrkH family potassium uptake protein [Desulfohalobiaceae bacterium]
MRWRFVLRSVGLIICVIGLLQLPLILVSLCFRDAQAIVFFQSLSLACSFGLLLYVLFRSHRVEIIAIREGMAIVSLGWVGAGLFGALPFYLSGQIPLFTDCVFEAFSGLTTTGASILEDVEALAPTLLLWRSLCHWLGGMGIILLSLAILPFLGVGGMQLYKAEVPGPTPDKLRPRIKDTALLLWKVYLLFSCLLFLLLLLGGMNTFQAVNHAFSTIATGGFSTQNISVGHFDSLYLELVMILFMLIAGTNFALHFRLLGGQVKPYWRNTEFRVFALLVLSGVVLVSLSVWGEVYDNLGESLRYSSFQVMSLITSTGYSTADYDLWPGLAQVVLLLCMLMGGCAGSTAGGMKCMRLILLFKHGVRELKRLIHPRAVMHLKIGGKLVPEEVLQGIWGYFVLYLFLTALSALALAAMGLDIVTAFTAVIACVSNIGPGFAEVGPAQNYSQVPLAGKWVLSLCMLLGRLEIYTVLIMFHPQFWKN